MSFQEYVLSKFTAEVIEEGKFKGWICFKTPLADYRIKREDWECIKKQIIQV